MIRNSIIVSAFLSAMAADAFKLIPSGPHTPRVTVDRLVVQRETWRTTVGETGLTAAAGESRRYLGVRAWRDRLGLPERVFAKLGSESKPVYVDFTSPASVASVRRDHRPLTTTGLRCPGRGSNPHPLAGRGV